MANIVATMMGVLFILIGIAGFVFNNLIGAHLTLTHNLIHLVSGFASLYFGLKGSFSAARLFGFVFGFVYLGLAVIGYWFGYAHGATYLPDAAADHAVNDNMFRMIPGVKLQISGQISRKNFNKIKKFFESSFATLKKN